MSQRAPSEKLKKLLQERHLTIEKAIDNCKSGDSTAQHLKDLAAASDTSEMHALKQRRERKPGVRSSKGAEELTSSNGEKVLLMAKHAESVERAIILQKFACSVDERKSLAPADQLTVFGGYSSDSSESLFTFRLAPGVESVHAMQTTVPSKINTAMKIRLARQLISKSTPGRHAMFLSRVRSRKQNM